jgi:hypothetical protein
MDPDENTAPEESAGAETDSKDDRVFSPLVTAQERKRMILERRKREREAAERNKISESALALERAASDSASSMSSRKRIRADCNAAEHHSQSDTSVSLSKQDDESQVEGTRSLFSFIRRRQEPIERALMNPFANDSKTPRAKGSSASLFGAVMERASLTPVASATPTKTTGLNVAPTGPFTPGEEGSGSQSRLRWDNSATPTSNSSNSRSRSMAAFQSPGGFGLQKILDSVTSPFHLKHIHRKTGDGDDDSSTANTSEEEKETPSVNDEWHHASLDVATGSLDVLDWTMKRKLRIECHPSHCLPGSITLSDGSDQDQSSPERKWERACRYWQHPSSELLPLHLKEAVEDTMSQSTKEVSASMLPSSSKASDMIHDVRGRHAFLSRFIRHAHDTEFWKECRLREWQEAFRSLYWKWINRLRELQSIRERGDIVSAKEILDASFYLIGSGQMVLCRVIDGEGGISPTVVLSSTSRQLRENLRDMGATLYDIRTTEDNGPFDEGVLEEVEAKKPQTENEPDMVHEELEALRRAQAHGENAGADVSVSMRSKRVKKSQSPRSIPPLCLIGEDDCAAFFELYLNTFGHYNSSWRSASGNVPMLFTRGLGSFQDASLKTLRLTNRRYDVATPQQDGVHSFLELRGQILPCALQELIGAAASQLTSDVDQETKPSAGASGDEEIGSHYFVLQAIVDDGNPSTRLDDTTTGTSGSHLFNQGPLNTDSIYCQPEAGMSMVVWDVARPDSVAFKVDASTLDGLHT